MRSMRMPYSVRIISWLLLVAVIGALGLSYDAAAVSGEKIGDFFKYANGTALDTRTNLMWMTQDFRNLEGRAPASWEEAIAWAEKMNQQRYGGYSDWRVPTPEEYKTLYDPRRSRMSYAKQPVGYPEAFEDGGGEWFWTGETYSSTYTYGARVKGGRIPNAYGFDFRRGNVFPRDIEAARDDLSVRLVRPGSPRP